MTNLSVHSQQTSLPQVSVAIYTGEGASHSWTWFVETLERHGYTRIKFLDEIEVQQGRCFESDVFILGGGDAFAMARALGKEGADEIKKFINAGGFFIGSCAGAYLLMNMDMYPLNLFSLTSAKVLNIVDQLPPCRQLPEKFFTNYGSRYVLHPVREAVQLKLRQEVSGIKSIFLLAPLYGGPPIQITGEAEEIARYQDFVPETLFLTDEGLSREMFLDCVAAFTQKIGRGQAYLFGPHVEHPSFSQANRLVINILETVGATKPVKCSTRTSEKTVTIDSNLLWETKGHLSDARLVAYGLEMLPLVWKIGHKTYEPGKIRVFLETIWQRYSFLKRDQTIPEEDLLQLYSVREMAAGAVKLLRQIKSKTGAGDVTLDHARELFPLLKKLSTTFLEVYFSQKNNWAGEK
jgi:glutamine amidotransferase-like uncharacterized protein